MGIFRQLFKCSVLVHLVYSSPLDHIQHESNNNEAIKCIDSYFQFNFQTRTMPQIYIVQEPNAYQTQMEKQFYKFSNIIIDNPITIIDFNAENTTRIPNENVKKIFIIFLSVDDMKTLLNFRMTNNPNSFLYVMISDAENLNEGEKMIQLEKIFRGIFKRYGATVMIMLRMNGDNNDKLIWKVFKYLPMDCSKSLFVVTEMGACKTNENSTLFLTMLTTDDCPIRVAGINNSPFAYYDEKNGFSNGIDYHLVRVLCEKLQKSIEFHFINSKKLVTNEAVPQ